MVNGNYYFEHQEMVFQEYFYSKCNKINSIICIMQTPQNNVFGGFTSLTWPTNAIEIILRYMLMIHKHLCI